MKKILLTITILLIFGALFTIWDNNRIVTTEYRLTSDRIDGSMKIAQVSDFHNCEKLGDKMLERIKKEAPQIIVITGDFIDGSGDNYDYALDVADQLTKIAPTYYVTGNHEIVDLGSEYRGELKDRGVVILSGEKVPLRNNVDLYGIEDPFYHDSISTALGKFNLDKDKYNILLSHRPEAFARYKKTDFDLVLTGHVHGGQFRIPFVGGLISPDFDFFPKYDAGLYEKNGTTMIVSRGIGNSIIPVRINNPAELVIVDLSNR